MPEQIALSRRMKKALPRLAIVLFWALATCWLIKEEAFPTLFARSILKYRDLVSDDMVMMDAWMKITLKGHPIGYSHTRVDVDEDHPVEHYKLNNETMLHLMIMGERLIVSTCTSASLDIMQTLQTFTLELNSGQDRTRIHARRRSGSTFDLKIKGKSSTRRMKIDIPDDVVFYSPMTEMSLKKLKPGQTMRIRTIEPASLSPVNILVEAIGKEMLLIKGREIETMKMSVRYAGMDLSSWIDPNTGRAVRQETPLGWIMEACSAEEAIDSMKGTGAAPHDLLTATAVPCHGIIDRPRTCEEIRVKLVGASFTPTELQTDRQEQTQESEATLLAIRKSTLPAQGLPLDTAPDNMTNFLAATAFVQSDHPRIIAQSKKITAESNDSLDAALAIFDWVYKKVEKKPTVSLPSAVDVLSQMEGDCNEHTYLFAALSRASNIPAKIMVGIVYKDGSFYYHAWPAVYVGRWVEMDPTWGQQLADATHISLLEGEIASQLKLLKVFGKLNIEILSETDVSGAMP